MAEATEDVPADVAALVDRLADLLGNRPEMSLGDLDPYLGQHLLSATLLCDKGLRDDSVDERRRSVRLGIERLRHALRDVVADEPTNDVRDPKDVARWLVDTLAVPQARIAELLDVSPRTLQRWISTTDPASPEADDLARLYVVARVAAHLRHVFTGPGVVKWFERPLPALGDVAPAKLLSDPLRLPELVHVASRSRSTIGT